MEVNETYFVTDEMKTKGFCLFQNVRKLAFMLLFLIWKTKFLLILSVNKTIPKVLTVVKY